jgi:diaminopimelate decarboxylase
MMHAKLGLPLTGPASNGVKKVPFTKKQIEELMKKHPTPFYIYEEAGIRESARKLINSFSWNNGFKEYFAVKALPNPEILRILKEEGCGADCSAYPELLIADQAGVTGEDIMFSSNDTPANEFIEAKKRGAIINLDDIQHLDYLERSAGLPELISFRYNPKTFEHGNAIIGSPAEAKYGLTKEQLFGGYKRAKEMGVNKFGLHTMFLSNELNSDYFVEAIRELFLVARDIQEKISVSFEFINLGGGLGIPYKPQDKEFDIKGFSRGVREAFGNILKPQNGAPIKLYMECGRYITGPHGYLVSSVRQIKETYKKYVGLDACMANLMRPAMYGAYHSLTVLGKENEPKNFTYDVVGSLCENNDKFAIDRELPEIKPDDIIVIHDVGAHGHAMGFNYNGKLRSAEFLMSPEWQFKMIRRAETPDDYFATLKF